MLTTQQPGPFRDLPQIDNRTLSATAPSEYITALKVLAQAVAGGRFDLLDQDVAQQQLTYLESIYKCAMVLSCRSAHLVRQVDGEQRLLGVAAAYRN